jgi:hypothetical protein
VFHATNKPRNVGWLSRLVARVAAPLAPILDLSAAVGL